MNIVRNFLPINYFNELKNSTLSPDFPWYYLPYTAFSEDEYIKYNGTFSNVLYTKFENGREEKNFIVNCNPVLEGLSSLVGYQINLLRIRFGLITTTPHKIIHRAHVDFPFPHRTAVMYLTNCNDAPTILYDAFYKQEANPKNEPKVIIEMGKEVERKSRLEYSECVENNIVIFNGLQFHSSTSPVLEDRRIVINVNFI
jgi:hypothetical protein